MRFVWQIWNLDHCARHGVTSALAEAVVLAADFTLATRHAPRATPRTDSVRRIGHGTVGGVRYKIVFQRGEPDEIFIISCYRAKRGSRKHRPRSDKP